MHNIPHKMVNVMIFTTLAVCTTWASAKTTVEAQWGKTVKTSKKEQTTTLQFYFHDIQSGKSPTAVPIAKPMNQNPYPTGFGELIMMDDSLTVGPDANSKLVGRAQGLYGLACQDEMSLLMALSYSFIDGPYEGSTISIMGRNSVLHPIRELPVVGGTGLFRMARGYALAHTYWFDAKAGDAIVGYNVTIVH